jgi:hypothetical protein
VARRGGESCTGRVAEHAAHAETSNGGRRPVAAGKGVTPAGTVISTGHGTSQLDGTNGINFSHTDTVFTQAAPFTFNGQTHLIKMKRGVGQYTAEGGIGSTCGAGPCGLAGCYIKTQ